MIKEVKLPEVSDNIENGDVVKVLVSVGDKIEIDQPIIELETDKAMFEVPSTEKGVVKEINVKQGDVIDIGAVILKVETNGEDSKEEKSAEAETSKEEKESEEKTKKSTKEKSDDKESANKELADKETENKATEEKEPEKKKSEEVESKGKESKDKKSTDKHPGDKESKDTESKDTETKDDNESQEKESTSVSEKKTTTKDSQDKKPKIEAAEDDKTDKVQSKEYAPASPSVRRLARELGVDINMVNGSGSGSRITEDDIKNYVKSILSDKDGSGISVKQKALPDFEKWGEVDIQPMSKVRVITAETLTYAWTTIPAVTQFDKADITQLEEFRKKYSKKLEEKNGHLTVTSILVKICASALKAFPQFNSSIDFNEKKIIYKKYFNLGIAVDTDRGLLVPVIKNADRKNITDISIELTELAEKARNKKITPDEMDGGNFTISNLGGMGGTNFTPIIYSPQVAILGVSRASKEPFFINDKFETRLMLPLSLTYDHRIIDGADAARFLRWISEALENPILMVLGIK